MPASALKALSSISRIDLMQSLEQILEEILKPGEDDYIGQSAEV